MKFLTLVLSLYILLLATVPCCAANNCREKSELSTADTGGSQKENCNNCSPFALCGSCSGFAQQMVLLQVETPQQPVSVDYHDFVFLYFPPSFSSFWQPPRLS
ncbi:MAG: DUF6660 family protein [Bacteroidota bacterium]